MAWNESRNSAGGRICDMEDKDYPDDFEPFPMGVAVRFVVFLWVGIGLVVWAFIRGCN